MRIGSNLQTHFSWLSFNPQINSYLSGVLLIIGAALIIPCGNFRQVNAIPKFWFGIGVMSLGFISSWQLTLLKKWWFWTVIIATRILLIFMYPGDEIWRYLWEGYLQTQNFSPYDFVPNDNELIPYQTEWWSLIQNKHSATVYPPIAQLGFSVLASISLDLITFKIAFVLADLLICWLLTRKFTPLKVTLYAWNPLVIYSFAGGGYYDSWFILPLVTAWLIFDYTRYEWRWLGSALLLGISIAIKWISLPLLGFLGWQAFRKLNFKQVVAILIYGLLPLVFTTVDFCHSSCSILPAHSIFAIDGRSADLMPYLLEKIWQPPLAMREIVLFLLALIGICLLSYRKTFQQFTESYLFTVLIFSPFIQGWYFTWIVPFGVPTQNWGVRLVSISAFVYFVLPYRQALGDRSWQLSDLETFWLWFPFVIGYGWSLWRRRRI